MTKIELVTRTVEVQGLELPWVHRKGYAPNRNKIIDSGTVFVPMIILQEVAARSADDYIYGTPSITLLLPMQHALEQAKLAERDARGGYYGTDKLRRLLGTKP